MNMTFLISMLLIVFSCSIREDKKTAVAISDNSVIKQAGLPGSLIGPYLSQDSLARYRDKAGNVKANTKAGKPFNALDYDKLIAYEFKGDEEMYPNCIDKKGKFIPVITKQKALTQKQADEMTVLLSINSTYGNTTASCFEPHLGLVFYKENKMVMQVSVCLLCNYLQSSIEIPAETFKKENHTGYKIPQRGFSKTGRQKIKALCDELDFDYSRKETMFDK